MSFRRVLVTGGAGFIGSNFVRYALQTHPEWEIVVLDKLTYAGNLENLRGLEGRIRFLRGDIADPRAVREALQGAEAVVNFAAESHVDRSLMDPRPFVRTNVEGTLVLLSEALRAGVQRFLQISTDEVYGDWRHTSKSAKEEDPLQPRSPYAASKAAADHLVLAYGHSHNLDVVITRGSNTYGPYQYPEKIIPLFLTNALEGKPLPVYGDGSAVRDYLHVEDHCRGIDLVLHQGERGGVYNLGARLQVSALQVAEMILDLLGKPRNLIRFVEDRPGHDYRYSVDPTRAEALGWTRLWSFEEGLRQTAEWYTAHPEWWRPLKRRSGFRHLERALYTPRFAPSP
ncbi:dTDP-glucose 4,6-dehydratase [Thermus caldilimi]|uniref:dTDP-glucose 4,6-dehydratase n=1 Tax=Thermus caldilimi TaxID=2483360 RepID=UPI001075D38C|nr:dTDP-glucose 4,6-dehydratase [Thermus caldilimi]